MGLKKRKRTKMQTRSSAAANAEKPYGDVSFTLESGLSTDEILRKSDSSSAIVWDEFESEKINSTSDLSKQRRRRRRKSYQSAGCHLERKIEQEFRRPLHVGKYRRHDCRRQSNDNRARRFGLLFSLGEIPRRRRQRHGRSCR